MPTTPAHVRSFVTALLVLSIGASTAAAQAGGPLGRRLDSIAGAGVAESHAIGIAAAIVKGKDTLLLRGYGKSDVEANVPMAADAQFPIGSVTKQFTAAAILQLRDAGKLSLDDDITKWLPDFDTRGNKVTLRHLLGHTSGILSMTEMPELRGLPRDTVSKRDSAYRVIAHHAFQFPTGTMQIYSNSGFFLLGLVVEKASGMTYEEYVDKNFFAPLGMSRSMYCNNSRSVPGRAYGYGMRNGNTRRAPAIVHTWPFAAGSLCSTAGDLATWLQALHGGRVLSQKSYTEMITPSKLNDGTPTRYAMGLVVGEDSRGRRYIGHDGGITGFSSDTKWYPDAHVAVVVLTNTVPDFDPVAVAEQLADEVLPAMPATRAFTGDGSSIVGTYKGAGRAGDMVIVVTQTPQGLSFAIDGAAAVPLAWIDGLMFRRKGSVLSFRRNANPGAADELHYDTGGDHFILKRQ